MEAHTLIPGKPITGVAPSSFSVGTKVFVFLQLESVLNAMKGESEEGTLQKGISMMISAVDRSKKDWGHSEMLLDMVSSSQRCLMNSKPWPMHMFLTIL